MADRSMWKHSAEVCSVIRLWSRTSTVVPAALFSNHSEAAARLVSRKRPRLVETQLLLLCSCLHLRLFPAVMFFPVALHPHLPVLCRSRTALASTWRLAAAAALAAAVAAAAAALAAAVAALAALAEAAVGQTAYTWRQAAHVPCHRLAAAAVAAVAAALIVALIVAADVTDGQTAIAAVAADAAQQDLLSAYLGQLCGHDCAILNCMAVATSILSDAVEALRIPHWAIPCSRIRCQSHAHLSRDHHTNSKLAGTAYTTS